MQTLAALSDFGAGAKVNPAGQTDPAKPPNGKHKAASGEPEQSPAGAADGETISSSLTAAERAEILKRMEPAHRKAYFAFQYAESKNGKKMEDQDAHAWLKEYGIPQDAGDLGELTDYELPEKFETFRTYLSAARNPLGESKYTRRQLRSRSRSIAKQGEIERRVNDE